MVIFKHLFFVIVFAVFFNYDLFQKMDHPLYQHYQFWFWIKCPKVGSSSSKQSLGSWAVGQNTLGCFGLIFGYFFQMQASSSSDSLDGSCVDYAKSYDAVVFDVLKVTPEEFAVSKVHNGVLFMNK